MIEFEEADNSYNLSSFYHPIYKLKSGELFKQLTNTTEGIKEFLNQFRLAVIHNPEQMDNILMNEFSDISGEALEEKEKLCKIVLLRWLCAKWSTNPNRNCLELSHEDTSIIVHNLKYLRLNIPAVHGFSYQAKQMVYYFMKLYAETFRQIDAREPITYENFTVGSEKKEFGKFDDIALKYDKDGKTFFHLIQVKHVECEDKLLTKNELETNEKFKIIIYYKSFLKLRTENDKINYSNLTLLTNIMISSDLYKIMEIVKDPLFDIENVHEIKNPEKLLDYRQPQNSKYKRLEILKLKKNNEFYKTFKNIKESKNELLDEFFDKFRIVVGAPDEIQMDAVLRNQFKQISSQIMSEFIDQYHFKIFWDYFKEKGDCDPDLRYENMETIILLIKIRANNFKLVSDYDSLLKDVIYDVQDPIIIQISEYFNSRISTDLLVIKTDFHILTLAKVFQCLTYETFKNNNSELLIIQFESDVIKNEHIDMLENIRYFNFCVIIFHKNIEISKQNQILSKVIRKSNIKVIIIGPTNLDGQINSLIDNVQFKNLTTNTKNHLLSRKTNFDGSQVVLGDLTEINALENFSGSDWLSKLVIGQQFCTKVPKIKKNSCYVERVVKWRNKFNPMEGYKTVEVYNGFGNNKFFYNEKNFNEFKRTDKDGQSIHLLEKIVSPNNYGVCWIKTLGDMSYIRELADHYSDVTELNIINSERKLNIFVSPEGMGKTTILKSIYFKTKIERPKNNWIEFISLPKYVTVLKNVYKTMDPIEFILKHILTYDGITAELFMNHTIGDKNLIFMFDSFDEIWPENKDFVINLINNLILLPNIKKIYLTSRPAYLSYFEHFPEIPFNLDYFSIEQQIDYIINCFKLNSINTKDLSKKTIKSYINQLKNSYKLDLQIPFQAEMATEFLIENNGKNLNFSKIDFDKFQFYKFCVQKKYNKYKLVKHNANLNDYSFQVEYRESISRYDKWHQELARMQFEDLATPEDYPENNFIIINNIGMVMIAKCEKVIFSHLAFADYFMAQFLCDVLTGKLNLSLIKILRRFPID